MERLSLRGNIAFKSLAGRRVLDRQRTREFEVALAITRIETCRQSRSRSWKGANLTDLVGMLLAAPDAARQLPSDQGGPLNSVSYYP